MDKFWTINVYGNKPDEHVGTIDGIKATCTKGHLAVTFFGGWYPKKRDAVEAQIAMQKHLLENARKEVQILTAALEA